MKKLVVLLIALLFSFCVAEVYVYKTPKDIVIIPPKIPSTTSTQKPLSLESNDIKASYYDGVVTFIFNKDLGYCMISISNIDSGEMWNATHRGEGSTDVTASTISGTYHIDIDTYYGTYTGGYIVE